jgi:hypothetical protein
MRYIVELPSAKTEAIQSLIDSGNYRDLQSFILTAVENQLYIEKQPVGHVTRSHFPAEEAIVSTLSSTLMRLQSDSSEVTTVEDPQPDVLVAETLWALHNRVFPVKITLRVLLNIVRSNPGMNGFVDLAIVQDAATEEAIGLAKVLYRIDKKSHRMPGEKLTAGLPRSTDRARNRFRFHFVGSVNSRNRLEGAPAVLRFVDIRRNEQGCAQIGITKSGLQFASLENPILDRADYSSALSKEEADFYLHHISENLVKEYALSIGILKAIESGHTTPDELTRVILDEYTNAKKEEAHAIRSSLIGRLSELGLLTRRRSGLKVTYGLTRSGHEIIGINGSKSG